MRWQTDFYKEQFFHNASGRALETVDVDNNRSTFENVSEYNSSETIRSGIDSEVSGETDISGISANISELQREPSNDLNDENNFNRPENLEEAEIPNNNVVIVNDDRPDITYNNIPPIVNVGTTPVSSPGGYGGVTELQGSKDQNKKRNRNIVIGVILALILGYVGYRYFKNKK